MNHSAFRWGLWQLKFWVCAKESDWLISGVCSVSLSCSLLDSVFCFTLNFAGGIFVLQIPPSCCKKCSTGLWCNFLLFWTESCGTIVFRITESAQHPKETWASRSALAGPQQGQQWLKSVHTVQLAMPWPSVSAFYFFRTFCSRGEANFVYALLPSQSFMGALSKYSSGSFFMTLLVLAIFW